MAHLDFNIFVVKNIAQVQPIPVLSKRTKINIKMSYYPAFLSIYYFAWSRSQPLTKLIYFAVIYLSKIRKIFTWIS